MSSPLRANFIVWTELKPLVKLKEEPQIISRLEKKLAGVKPRSFAIKPAKPEKKRR
jgi:hypothetical protein